jgi:thiol:disulfide interchange protein DsbC
MKIIINLLLGLTVSLSFNSYANNPEQKFIDDAENKLQATFKNLQFTNFKESPIKGLYELNIGAQIIYFDPKTGYLVFGEIFNEKGESLTAKEIKTQNKSNSKGISTEHGIVIGNPNASKTIIEFTDPGCPYCLRYNQFITERNNDDVKRVIYFDTRIHPKAAIAAEHIICSENQTKAMKEIYEGKKPQSYKSCKKGKKILRHHATASKKAGVRGTPSFLLDGELLVGFRKKELLEFLGNKPKWQESSIATK